MSLAHDWAAIWVLVGAVLIAVGGLFLIFGSRRLGGVLILYGVASAIGGSVIQTAGFSDADWSAELPHYIDGELVSYALYVVGFLVAMNLFRHLLALFVGYGAADSAVGGLLATVVTFLFTALSWPIRALRRLGRVSRNPLDDI